MRWKIVIPITPFREMIVWSWKYVESHLEVGGVITPKGKLE